MPHDNSNSRHQSESINLDLQSPASSSFRGDLLSNLISLTLKLVYSVGDTGGISFLRDHHFWLSVIAFPVAGKFFLTLN